MKGAQQTVKYLAIAFAVFLICGICLAIAGAGTLAEYVLGGFSGAGDSSEWSEVAIGDKWDFDELVIEVKATNVRIEYGEEFQVLADEDVIEFRRGASKVYLEEKDFGLFGNWHKIGGELKVTLPKDQGVLKKVTIDVEAGTVYAEGLVAEEVDLELGAGRAEFVGLVAKNKAKISGGAGYLVVRDADLKDLNLDMGVGKVEIRGKIGGNGEVDAGVGKLEMVLKGRQDDYRMEFSKGLGSIMVNGTSMGDGEVWGKGKDLVKIDGGVGAIEIRVEEE